jgi:phosphopantetheinyl transferase (holo-ACP synthase)
MNILGLGFDATDIPRVREVFQHYGERFIRRILTEGEIA